MMVPAMTPMAVAQRITAARPNGAFLVAVFAAARFVSDSTVSCGVPGHDRKGYEVVMDLLEVNAGALDFAFERRCGFVATFDYRSD
jgi:hypothetical protein